MVIVAYLPPIPKANGVSACASTVAQLCKWIDKMLMETCSSCAPVLCADSNDGIGFAKVGRTWEDDDSTGALGRSDTREKLLGGAGSQRRPIFDRRDMVFANT